MPPFRFFDKGNLATVSTTFAIFEKGRWRLSGGLAKLMWAFIHILYLSAFENRLLVLLAWAWTAVTRGGGARLIEDPSYAELTSEARSTMTSAKSVRKTA